jgi:hypothetical protein
VPIAEDNLYNPAYFLDDFLLDRFGRFFPAGPRLTISWPDDGEFKFYTDAAGLQKFADKLERLFHERVESPKS